ncbi:unnamed protein product [Closterium sp. Naga37s-1]|nr:unnamed protein product [Closterium sp. Naga37s-1]
MYPVEPVDCVDCTESAAFRPCCCVPSSHSDAVSTGDSSGRPLGVSPPDQFACLASFRPLKARESGQSARKLPRPAGERSARGETRDEAEAGGARGEMRADAEDGGARGEMRADAEAGGARGEMRGEAAEDGRARCETELGMVGAVDGTVPLVVRARGGRVVAGVAAAAAALGDDGNATAPMAAPVVGLRGVVGIISAARSEWFMGGMDAARSKPDPPFAATAARWRVEVRDARGVKQLTTVASPDGDSESSILFSASLAVHSAAHDAKSCGRRAWLTERATCAAKTGCSTKQ